MSDISQLLMEKRYSSRWIHGKPKITTDGCVSKSFLSFPESLRHGQFTRNLELKIYFIEDKVKTRYKKNQSSIPSSFWASLMNCNSQRETGCYQYELYQNYLRQPLK